MDPCKEMGLYGSADRASIDPAHRKTKVSRMVMPSEREIRAMMTSLYPSKYGPRKVVAE